MVRPQERQSASPCGEELRRSRNASADEERGSPSARRAEDASSPTRCDAGDAERGTPARARVALGSRPSSASWVSIRHRDLTRSRSADSARPRSPRPVRLDRSRRLLYDPPRRRARDRRSGADATRIRPARPAQGGATAMRDHNKAFCRLVAETFDCPGPVFEFGSYQVEGQEGYANLRGLFPGKTYVGCDMRPGPGWTGSRTSPRSACPTTRPARSSASRHSSTSSRCAGRSTRSSASSSPAASSSSPSPLNFRIHGYPDDYWRMTPNCLRQAAVALRGAGGRLSGPSRVPAHGHGRGHQGACSGRRRRRAEQLVAGLSATGSAEPRRACRSARSSGGGCRSSIAPRASGTRSPTTTRRISRSTSMAAGPARAERAERSASCELVRRTAGGTRTRGSSSCQRPSIDWWSWAWTGRPGPCSTRCGSGA